MEQLKVVLHKKRGTKTGAEGGAVEEAKGEKSAPDTAGSLDQGLGKELSGGGRTF